MAKHAVSHQLRHAIGASTMSRFLRGKRALSMVTLDRITELLDVAIVETDCGHPEMKEVDDGIVS